MWAIVAIVIGLIAWPFTSLGTAAITAVVAFLILWIYGFIPVDLETDVSRLKRPGLVTIWASTLDSEEALQDYVSAHPDGFRSDVGFGPIDVDAIEYGTIDSSLEAEIRSSVRGSTISTDLSDRIPKISREKYKSFILYDDLDYSRLVIPEFPKEGAPLELLGTFRYSAQESNDAAFRELATKAVNELRPKTLGHQAAWGLGNADRWDLNQDDGILIFTFPDKVVTCEAQIIGSFDASKGTWLWAWNNPHVEKSLTRHAAQVLKYGKEHGYAKLTKAEWEASQEDAWQMAAIATLLCDAQGAYRGPADDVYVFMTFGKPKIQKR